MKHLKLFEQFVSEAKVISIVKMMTPPMSSDANRGKMDTVEDLEEIKQYLKDADHFTDDEVFVDDKGNEYFIGDLINKEVTVGKEVIKVTESVNEADASTWTKAQLDKELKELRQGTKESGDIDDSMAFDIADNWISDNPGVEVSIKKHYNASDAQGFVANRIV